VTSVQILSETRRRGIELRAEGDRLLFRSAQTVSPELRTSIRRHKAELLELLRRPVAGIRTQSSGVDNDRLKKAEKEFTCLDIAPPNVILCIVHPEQPEYWLAYRRTNRKQQGLGGSQATAVLDLARVETVS
jgi:hypothetical protein